VNAHSRQRQLRRLLTLRATLCIGLLTAALAGSLLSGLMLLHALDGASTGAAAVALATLLAVAGVGVRLSRWLWVPTPDCAGIVLPDALAPGFRRRIDRLCARLGARRIDRVLATPEVNAAVVCRPAFGLFGPMRTTLLLGIPLAHCLTPQQLSAVLAHELAHLSAQRGRRGAWAAHLRTWWLRCFDRIDEDDGALARAARRVFARTARTDLEQSVQLSRLDEFEADALAARAVGAPALAGALIDLAMKDRFLTENYWTKVMEQARSNRRPRIRPFREMGLGMQVGFVRDDALADLDHLLGVRADTAAFDTHPALAERLAALDIDHADGLPDAADGPSAAEHYFADLLPTLSLAFDRMWWLASSRDWRQQYRSARADRR